MDRAGTLPDRCITCNAPAQGNRLRRKLYCSPAAWKIGASLAPFAALAAGVYLDVSLLAYSFWPLVVILIVANMVVRKSLKLEVGICPRHRDLRFTLIALSWTCIVGVFAGIFTLSGGATGAIILLGSLLALVVLVVVQSFVGAQAVSLKDVSPDYAWLAGTGEAFRSALPELN